MIPKLLHLIWVGDEARRPDACIASWRDQHPGWTVKVWGNAELRGRDWVNAAHMKAMAAREWNGVADMMRWEILFEEGGVLVDADSFCVRTLPDWMLECEAFACWENELVRPGLVAAGYFGTVPRNPFVGRLVEGIRAQASVTDRMAWESVGPLFLTDTWRREGYQNLTILPSHFFIPRHFTGHAYSGSGPVFARQEWGSTLKLYDRPGGVSALDPASLGQVFLAEPSWTGAEWAEIVLSYLEAFRPGDPVVLALVLDPATAPPLAAVEPAVIDLLARTGRERIPDIALVDDPADLVEILARHPLACRVPQGMGNAEGFRGALGLQFAQARLRMAGR